LNESLNDLSKEDLIKKFFSVEFARFSNYYKKSKDLNTANTAQRQDSDGSIRYFINIGSKDGYDWMSLKDLLKELLNFGREDVFKVDCKESFSFFNTDADKKEAILSFFQDFKLDGRFVNVEISNNTGGGGGGHRGKRKRFDDRKGDGKRGRRDDRRDGNFEGRKDRRKRRDENRNDDGASRKRRSDGRRSGDGQSSASSSDKGKRKGPSFQGRRSRRD
jgi:ATP-dependent RNA helicase DeaD